MNACNVLTVFGTRPEAIKMFPVVHALQADPRFAVTVCTSGQHRALLDQVLELAGIVPDHDLAVMQPGQSLDALMARLVVDIGTAIDTARPDWVLVQGDTATAAAGALAAYHRQVPVAHIEAGLRSGDSSNPWPEEVYRQMIGTIAALHFAPTARAAQALLQHGADPSCVHITGNTGIDALQWVAARIEAEPARFSELDDLLRRFAGRRIVAVTAHRRENLGAGLAGIAAALARLAQREDLALVVPLHPNPAVREGLVPALAGRDNVALIEPLDYPHFTRLLSVSHLVLTDSGGVQEETPSFARPVLVLRDTTERPEGIEAGTARLVGTDPARIVAAAEHLLDDPAAYAAMARAHNPFGDGQAAGRIVRLLAAAAGY